MSHPSIQIQYTASSIRIFLLIQCSRALLPNLPPRFSPGKEDPPFRCLAGVKRPLGSAKGPGDRSLATGISSESSEWCRFPRKLGRASIGRSIFSLPLLVVLQSIYVSIWSLEIYTSPIHSHISCAIAPTITAQFATLVQGFKLFISGHPSRFLGWWHCLATSSMHQ